jgi:hypothetical protein
MTAPTVDADVKKTGRTLVGKLTVKNIPTLPSLDVIDLSDARKPGFAAVGVLDLAIEQVKDLPADAKKAQDKVQADALARFATATELAKTVPAQLKTLPTQVKTLRTEVEGRVATATEKANELYAALAVRGERLVTSIRRQPATEAAIAEGKEAVKKSQAAATAAKRSVKAGEKALEDAAEKLG